MYKLSAIMADLFNDIQVVCPCCGRVQSPNDVTQKVEKTLNNTNRHRNTKANHNGFRNTKKDPIYLTAPSKFSLVFVVSWNLGQLQARFQVVKFFW